MASAGNGNKQAEPLVFRETAFPYILFFIGILILLRANSCDMGRGLSGGNQTVKIRPYWSEMINVPVNKDIAVYREDRKPFEICFWSQRPGKCLNGSRTVKKEKWFGDVRASSFRIRGEEGFATIMVSR